MIADQVCENNPYDVELPSRAAERLFDALWTKERELCDALHLGRKAIEDGIAVGPNDPALQALSLESCVRSPGHSSSGTGRDAGRPPPGGRRKPVRVSTRCACVDVNRSKGVAGHPGYQVAVDRDERSIKRVRQTVSEWGDLV
jgi:hypothetical protein